MNDTQAVTGRSDAGLVRAEDFLPVLSVQQAVERKAQINEFINKVLVESMPAKGGEPRIDGDYGRIPGAGDKKVLLKPGAEKLCSIFGLAPKYAAETVIEDWTGEQHGKEPLFYYALKCQLYRGDRFMGEAIGSSNSRESKHRYRWVPEDAVKDRPDLESLPKRGGRQTLFQFQFALDRRELTGQYGKPVEYWDRFDAEIAAGRARKVMKATKRGESPGWEIDVDTTLYRIPNPDVADVINTVQKMAQKRALVAAVLVVTNCSDAFTQDLEDQIEPEARVETHEELVDRRIAEEKARVAEAPQLLDGKPIPEELAQFLNDCGAGKAKEIFGTMEDRFMAAGGKAGHERFKTICEAWKRKSPGKTKPLADVKACLIELWLALAEIGPAFRASDEDMPPELGGTVTP